MNFKRITENAERNETSENGLTIFEKDVLIRSMHKKLKAINEHLEHWNASSEDAHKKMLDILNRED